MTWITDQALPQELTPEQKLALRARQRPPTAEDVVRVVSGLERAQIDCWLHGGWAVEGLVKRSLLHQDIDVFVMEDRGARLRQLLGQDVVLDRGDFLVWNSQSVEVDIVLVRPYRKNLVTWRHRDLLWVAPDPRLAGQRVELGGRSLPIVSPLTILVEQEHTVRKKRKAMPKMLERAAMLRQVLPPAMVAQSRRWWPVRATPLREWLYRWRLLWLWL